MAAVVVVNRERPVSSYTLSHEARAAVEVLAEEWGVNRSAVVEQLIRRGARREGVDLKRLKTGATKRRRTR